MSKSIFVIAELSGEGLHPGSLEVIALAGALEPSKLTVVVLGDQLADIEDQLKYSAVDSVIKVEHPCLQHYSADAYLASLMPLINEWQPELVLLAHSYQARDYAPALAYEFGKSLVGDAVRVENGSDAWLVERQMFQGRALAEYRVKADGTAFVSVQPGAYSGQHLVPVSAAPAVTQYGADLADGEALRTRHIGLVGPSDKLVNLTDAKVIVAVGRGIKAPENLVLAQRLADCLGGTLAASRPVCDEGWMPHGCQIGSSGQTVSPKLYIALGISGAAQHLVGMKGASTIVAVNKDPNAPIFKIADVAVVGDLFEFVPKLVEELELAKKQVVTA